jgi:hypothetical protein
MKRSSILFFCTLACAPLLSATPPSETPPDNNTKETAPVETSAKEVSGKETAPNETTAKEETTAKGEAPDQTETTEANNLAHLYVLPVGDPPKVFRNNDKTTKGFSIQIDPPSGERIPFSMKISHNAIPESVKKTLQNTQKPYGLRLIRNHISNPILIKKTEEGGRLIFQKSSRPDMKIAPFSWPFKLYDLSEALAIISPKHHSLNKPWINPDIAIIDVSADQLPANSILVINRSAAEVETKLKDATTKLHYGEQQLIPNTEKPNENKSRISLRIAAIDKNKTTYLCRSLAITPNTRQILVIYNSPKTGAKVKARLRKAKLPNPTETKTITH